MPKPRSPLQREMSRKMKARERKDYPTIRDIRAGLSAIEFKKRGFDALEGICVGYSVMDLINAGYSKREVIWAFNNFKKRLIARFSALKK